MGYGDFGCFNGGLSQTPALDALVAEGVCLTQHYSASPVCAPARASLLTGRYPHRTGAIDTLEMRGLDRLALRERTIADLLRRAGYATGLVGKWHNGALDARYHPNRRGFDEFAGFCGGWHPYFDWRLDRNGRESRTRRPLPDRRVHATRRSPSSSATRASRSSCTSPTTRRTTRSRRPRRPAPVRRDRPLHARGRHVYGMMRAHGPRHRARARDARARSGSPRTRCVLFSSDNGPQFGGSGEDCTDRFNCGFAARSCSSTRAASACRCCCAGRRGLDGRRAARRAGALHRLAADAARRRRRRRRRATRRSTASNVLPLLQRRARPRADHALLAVEPLHARAASATRRCATATGSSCGRRSASACGSRPRTWRWTSTPSSGPSATPTSCARPSPSARRVPRAACAALRPGARSVRARRPRGARARPRLAHGARARDLVRGRRGGAPRARRLHARRAIPVRSARAAASPLHQGRLRNRTARRGLQEQLLRDLPVLLLQPGARSVGNARRSRDRDRARLRRRDRPDDRIVLRRAQRQAGDAATRSCTPPRSRSGSASTSCSCRPTGLSETGLFVWLTVMAIAVRSTMALYLVPHNALGAELTADYHERTGIVGYRTLFGVLGGLTTLAARPRSTSCARRRSFRSASSTRSRTRTTRSSSRCASIAVVLISRARHALAHPLCCSSRCTSTRRSA